MFSGYLLQTTRTFSGTLPAMQFVLTFIPFSSRFFVVSPRTSRRAGCLKFDDGGKRASSPALVLDVEDGISAFRRLRRPPPKLAHQIPRQDEDSARDLTSPHRLLEESPRQ